MYLRNILAVVLSMLIVSLKAQHYNVPQRQTIDILVKAPLLPHNINPFDANINAIVTSKTGQIQLIPLWYNGNHTYVFRYSSAEIGTYTYSIMLEDSVLYASTIDVIENKNTLCGAVNVCSDTPNKFCYQNGTPYHALAFELDWLFALDMGNSNLQKTKQIVNTVKNNGFNQIVMNIYAYDVKWEVGASPKSYNYSAPTYTAFEGTNEKPNFDSLNLNLFNHLDKVFTLLHAQGIQAHVMIYVWNKKVNWPTMYSKEDNRYFDYVIKRYQAYQNIIWDISKEALDYGRCDINYIDERIARVRKLDAFKRLVTVHDYEYCKDRADNVDFISIQNWRSDLFSQSLKAFEKHNNKPVMNIEHGGYEQGAIPSFDGNYDNAETCLLRNYYCLFAGVYSTYYWQNTAWNIVVHDVLTPTYKAYKPRFDYYKHFAKFMANINFNTLLPHQQKLTTNSRIGIDNMASSGFALSDKKGRYIYLIPPENKKINIVIPAPPNKKIHITLFNPYTGVYTNKGVDDWWTWKAFINPTPGKAAIVIVEAQ